jgi:hypothetical protein
LLLLFFFFFIGKGKPDATNDKFCSCLHIT